MQVAPSSSTCPTCKRIYCVALNHLSLCHEYSYKTAQRVGNIFDINRWSISYIIYLYIHKSTTTCLTRLRRSPHTPQARQSASHMQCRNHYWQPPGPINEPATPRPGCSVCSVRHFARPSALCRKLMTVDLGCDPCCEDGWRCSCLRILRAILLERGLAGETSPDGCLLSWRWHGIR
jgi:hypothetical protein